MTLTFDKQVAIVTGAGTGLGRSHAFALASRGARVLVNDYGKSANENGLSEDLQETLELIQKAGFDAQPFMADVSQFTEVESMVNTVMDTWGRVDILVNNAGILRDKSFSKMCLDDFRRVIDVHLMGSVNCCKAVWDIMRNQRYGRIVMTASSSGLYGNFGQANYGAAKMALIGLMNTLALEGDKYNIRVNTLAPAAATNMTAAVIDDSIKKLLTTSSVSEALVSLCHRNASSKTILCAGAGTYSCSQMLDTEGMHFSEADQRAENILAHWDEISSLQNAKTPADGNAHIKKMVDKAL